MSLEGISSSLVPFLLAFVLCCQVLSGCVAPSSPTSGNAFPPSGFQSARVTYIIDGDTIVVYMAGASHKLRYIGMDTPEVGDSYYQEATEANRLLVQNQMVWLEKDVSETDQYGRLLRYVYLSNGTMVNERLVCDGYALVFTYPPDVRYADRFLACQRSAQSTGIGLWSLPLPQVGN